MVTLAAVSDQFRHQWVGWRSRQPRLQEIQVIDIGTHTRFIRQTESIVNDEGISPLIWVDGGFATAVRRVRSEEHTSELQSLMRISYAVFCLKNKIQPQI